MFLVCLVSCFCVACGNGTVDWKYKLVERPSKSHEGVGRKKKCAGDISYWLGDPGFPQRGLLLPNLRMAIFDVLLVIVFQMACADNSTKDAILIHQEHSLSNCPVLWLCCFFCFVCVCCFLWFVFGSPPSKVRG